VINYIHPARVYKINLVHPNRPVKINYKHPKRGWQVTPRLLILISPPT